MIGYDDNKPLKANQKTQRPTGNSNVPPEVANHFNWGAFLLSWIWGLGNKTYITLLVFPACFVPFVGGLICLGLQIWFGIKGNEWAWQNKEFQSLEHFHANQKKWAIAGTIIAIIGIIITVACYSLFAVALLSAPSITD